MSGKARRKRTAVRSMLAVAMVVAGGLASAPAALADGSVLEAGDRHTCAVKTDGTARCWGWAWDFLDQVTVPPDLGKVVSVTASEAHTCAVKVDGTARCWGDDTAGRATVPPDLGTVTSISAGLAHTCAVTTAGAARCWGDDRDGQSSVPPDLGTVSAISAGIDHTCAVAAGGIARCWGDVAHGQATVPSDLGTVSSISAGVYSTCAVTTGGSARCWGFDGRGAWAVPADLGTVTSISAGGSQRCAVRSDRTVRCWGRDDDGQASPPSDLGTVSAVSAGTVHTCALRDDGFVRCWGKDEGRTAVPADLGTVGPMPPAMSVRPSVSAPKWVAGETVTADPGTWDNDPTSYGYEWYRCTNAMTACAPIPGAADQATYPLAAADEGKRIRVRVTASNAEGDTRRFSIPSPVVGVPVNTTRPTLSGTTRTGDALTVDTGGWDPVAGDYDVEWLRCGTAYLDSCDAIEDATGTTYTLVDADDAQRVRARVIARNGAGSSRPATTAATVLIDRPTLIARPTLSGTAAVGATLTSGAGDWTGDPTEHRYEWLRCTTVFLAHCTKIAGAPDQATYALTAEDAGYRIRSRVQAENATGKSVARSTSLPSAKVPDPVT